MPMAKFEIAGFSIKVFGYERPNSFEYWDANWLDVAARCEAPGVLVSARGSFLRTDELRGLRDELLRLNNLSVNQARLDCIEPNLKLTFRRVGSLGRIVVELDISPEPKVQSHHFTLEADLSYIAPAIAALEKMLEAFPVKGSPDVR